MDGEQDTSSVLKEEGYQRRWPQELLPLVVLYSPLLRLRFRSALKTVTDRVNKICGRQILTEPQEASNTLALAVESGGYKNLQRSMVYVCDCETRKDTECHVLVFGDCAKIYLPENETSPLSTVKVTTYAILELLEVPYALCDSFSEKVVDFLKNKYQQ